MSGGHWDYQDARLKEEIFGWGDEKSNPLDDVELSQLVRDVFQLLHDYDWYASGDTDEETWQDARKEFKKKWLRAEGVNPRLQRIIDGQIDGLRRELTEMLEP